MKVFGLKYDKENIKQSNEAQRQIQILYDKTTQKIAKLAEAEKITIKEGEPLDLSKHPQLNRQIDREVKKLAIQIESLLGKNIKNQWELANTKNDDLVNSFLGKTKVPKKTLSGYMNRNLKALEAFQKRKFDGRDLSKRVWETAGTLKSNMEMALDIGLGEGKSAAELSRDVRKFLKEPNNLFRRVRDKHGGLHLSKEAKKYRPGAGVYRSSYKNAMRMTRTEINSAYRTADHLRVQKLDFVVGIEIRRSNNVYECDVCEGLKGKYPKDFKFTGWHPHCRCHALSILNKKEDFIEQQKAILEGREPDYSTDKRITELPPNFRNWMEQNADSIERAKERGTEPWWMKDNKKYVIEEKVESDDVYNRVKEIRLKMSENKTIMEDMDSLGGTFDFDKYYKAKHENESLNEEYIKLQDKLPDDKRVYRKLEYEEYERLFKLTKISEEEEKYLYGDDTEKPSYCGTFGYDINSHFRGGKYPNSKYTDDVVSEYIPKIKNVLDSLLDENQIEEDVTVFRYTEYNFLAQKLGLPLATTSRKEIIDSIDKLIGLDITDKAYMSASANEEFNAFKHYGVKLEVKVRKGTSAVVTKNRRESEIIFSREQKHKIVGWKEEGKYLVLETELF